MFRSILFLNGTLPNLNKLSCMKTLTSIAADGGALRNLLKRGYLPQIVIGDGDSLKESGNLNSIKIILNDDQETTDFEKCLQYIEESKLLPTLVCGIGGGEIDHQHNNLHCFAKYTKTHPMVFVDSQPGYKTKIGLSVRKHLTLEAEVGTTLSILPFPEASISSKGLAWNLKNERLAILKRSGARNRILDPKIIIEVNEGGPVLVVLDSRAVHNVIVDGWKVGRVNFD